MATEQEADIPQAIRNHFTVRTFKANYAVECRHCDRRWSWPLKPMSVGATLQLLNHAHSHDTDDA